MRLGPVAVLLLSLLTCLPYVSAQVPVPPADPAEIVALACATAAGVEPQARELLPPCALAEPQPPAAPEEQAEAQAPQTPATPGTAPELVDEILEDAQKVPQDPASAPDRLQAILATILQFVKDAIGAPGTAITELQADILDLRAGATDAAKGATEGARAAALNVRGAIAGALDAVRDLFDGAPASAPSSAKLPDARVPRDLPAADLLGDVRARLSA